MKSLGEGISHLSARIANIRMDHDVLMKKGKRAAGAYVKAECVRSSNPECLLKFLETSLDPLKDINQFDTIDWCRWLMAGGSTPDEFMDTVRRYDNATTCGLVWTANFVAYRCRTCGISPCMSLCAECFQRGNHSGHDFNMFRSQAGGACDCGDTNVMKESGFCSLHGSHQGRSGAGGEAPPDLLAVADVMMPRLFLRLTQFMREHGSSMNEFLLKIQDADKFITMLYDMSSMGAAMRRVMTNALTNPQAYQSLVNSYDEKDAGIRSSHLAFYKNIKEIYNEAMRSLRSPDVPEKYSDIAALQAQLVHKTFLEEFVFWTAKFEFPQKLVCLLLNLLPDPDYKDAFTRAFVLHYSRISQLLVDSVDAETLSNRVVHVSVQLYSNEKLAYRISEEMNLLHVMVISLQYMMKRISIHSGLQRNGTNNHMVVDCSHQVMKEHCYWPLVSDLNNVLSHHPVALMFLQDDGLIQMWLDFLSVFQGMNLNVREMVQHVEYEPLTYYAAFSAELEASASPMWALVAHLKDSKTVGLTQNLLYHCRRKLNQWFESIGMSVNQMYIDPRQMSFHLPLHRYYAVFMCQAVRNQGLSLAECLPPSNELELMLIHPLRAQIAFYEIISGLWVRNGLQIKGQAMTYIQCHFCNSMVDADIYLLQVGMMNLHRGKFIEGVIKRFQILEYFCISDTIKTSDMEPDQVAMMITNCLVFFASLASVRTSLGMTDEEIVALEMATLLCMGDKTHSQLMELMPERCGTTSQSKDFESVLAEVADYRAPNFESSGNMFQGMYVPKPEVWQQLYDPIHVLLRAVHRREFQTSLDRFNNYVNLVHHSGKSPSSSNLWPPFRIPRDAAAPYTDPRFLLLDKSFQGFTFVVLYKLVHTSELSDQVASLIIYLLEMAFSVCHKIGPQVLTKARQEEPYYRLELDFGSYYPSDCLLSNLCAQIDSVYSISNQLCNPGIVCDDMEIESYDGSIDMLEEGTSSTALPLIESSSSLSLDNASNRLALLPASNSSVTTVSRRSGELSRCRSLDAQVVEEMRVALSPSKFVQSSQKKSYDECVTEARQYCAYGQDPSEFMINESMISLLLKLHSKFSSSPDSYVPFWETAKAKCIIEDFEAGKRTDIAPAQSSFQSSGFCFQKLFNLVNDEDRRIGDGPYFIGKLLDRICASDTRCREFLMSCRESLWPKMEDDEELVTVTLRDEKEKAEKRRIAKERQAKLMAEFTARQKQFMKAAASEQMFGENEGNDRHEDGKLSGIQETEAENAATFKAVEYDCCICNLSSPSTDTNPICLVILVQSTSVLGHRKKSDVEEFSLPISQDGVIKLKQIQENSFTCQSERKLDTLRQCFDESSWLMSMSAGWQGGVHVHTCGHHLHLECLKRYQDTLKNSHRNQIPTFVGEYLCPFCRQLANSFLPLSPESGIIQGALAKNRSEPYLDNFSPESTVPRMLSTPESQAATEVMQLLREHPVHNFSMMDAMSKTMEDMTNSTRYRKVGDTQNPKSILLFINSIARTNLEVEIILRTSNWTNPISKEPCCSNTLPTLSASFISKRSCIVPLLHVLGVHYKILSAEPVTPKLWERILGIRFLSENSLMSQELPDVPMLLCDPVAILLHFLMRLPMHVDLMCFSTIVQAIYNLVFIQILCAISLDMSEEEVMFWWKMSSTVGFDRRQSLLATVMYYLFEDEISRMESNSFFVNDPRNSSHDGMQERSSSSSRSAPTMNPKVSEEEIESKIQSLFIPFLRITSLLKHHLYEQELPSLNDFHALCEYLGLKKSPNFQPNSSTHPSVELRLSEVRAHDYLNWISSDPLETISTWCKEVHLRMEKSQIACKTVIKINHLLWRHPRLLDLPDSYDSIFQFYHRMACHKCNSVPRKPSICLVCGAFVCMSDNCCKQPTHGICEAILHANDCGAGTVVYLNVHSTTIVVVRGRRACFWGSVYLDAFGEEDRDMKRGKPLFLSRERYALLQQQWLAHRFDHTNRRWMSHRDTL